MTTLVCWPVNGAATDNRPQKPVVLDASWYLHANLKKLPNVSPRTTVPTVTESPTTVTTEIAVPPPPPVVDAVPVAPSSDVTDADRVAWMKVAVCETGGNWQMQGSAYSGGVGFANSTWFAYGGSEFASNAGLATMDQQITVAKRIQPSPPDQNGCSGGW